MNKVNVLSAHNEVEQVSFSQYSGYTKPDSYLWIQPDAKHTRYIFSGSRKVLKQRLNSGFQYIPQFSLYPHKLNVNDSKTVNITDVIRMMLSAELKEIARQIQEAKELGDLSLKDKLKSQLPYITHSGVFNPRCNKGLKLPGFTYQLDIDKIDNADAVVKAVTNDKQLDILFACKSVSGNGVKALLLLKPLLYLRDEWTSDEYSRAYHNATAILTKYFLEKHKVKIDGQMKAISQPFFLFYAPDLYINKNLLKWI
ncbi:BT4734/BF3469 family protein [Pollutibacter soli]|uniref:BT4734/BF3469 family protein n=1 Tax=Pollutibacter soli TaxID=3034157 RepID=UPI003013AF90